MLLKEEIQARVTELQNALQQQQHLVQQVNNNILMIHGAIEEMKLQQHKIEEKEKLEAEEAKKKAEEEAKNSADAATQDDLCGEPKDEQQELQQAANG